MTTIAVSMASAAVVSAVFCGKLPYDVADLIFGFGFHVWLSIPHTMLVDARASSVYGGCVEVSVTVWLVREAQLSRTSGVNYKQYKAQVLSTFDGDMHDPAVQSFTVTSDDVRAAMRLPSEPVRNHRLMRSEPIPSRPRTDTQWRGTDFRPVWVCFGGRADLTCPGFLRLADWEALLTPWR